MSDVLSELSSLTTNIDELTSRIATLAENAQHRGDLISTDLYEIERTLRTAQRRLDKLLTPKGPGLRR